LAHTVIYSIGKYSTMPRLSLYRPEKGNDFKFIDRNIWEMFQVGGVDVLIHKYAGPGDTAPGASSPSIPNYAGSTTAPETRIQDLLFLENRDRKYDPDVYTLRGVYNIQDIDFNLSQFGLFLQNDTVFITFHINDTVEKLGRKIMAGDVIELPHLKDYNALNDLKFALKRFYVIQEVNRAAEGFSVTWYPHLYRAKCTPLVDSQEFKQILDGVADADNYQGQWRSGYTYQPDDVVTGVDGQKYTVISTVTDIPPPNSTYYKLADTLRHIMSTYEKEMQITQAVLDQAEADAPKSGFDTTTYYTVPVDDQGRIKLVTADVDSRDASDMYDDASIVLATPVNDAYDAYHTDGKTPNGAPFVTGIAFPLAPIEGLFCLRTDYFPKRLFRYDGKNWIKYEDNVRMTMSNTGPSDTTNPDNIRLNQKSSFINNTKVSTIDGHAVKQKQSLSKALRPQADE
jgi:hypothetical protein